MKTKIIKTASALVLLFGITSCKEDTTELIQKIETTQLELKLEDSILTNQRAELSLQVFTDTTTQKVGAADTLLADLVGNQNALITRLELIIQKNNELITQLKDDSANPKEVLANYTANTDEVEMMKAEINAAKDSYTKLVSHNDTDVKNTDDTTKLK